MQCRSIVATFSCFRSAELALVDCRGDFRTLGRSGPGDGAKLKIATIGAPVAKAVLSQLFRQGRPYGDVLSRKPYPDSLKTWVRQRRAERQSRQGGPGGGVRRRRV